jgi:hypothetical protein
LLESHARKERCDGEIDLPSGERVDAGGVHRRDLHDDAGCRATKLRDPRVQEHDGGVVGGCDPHDPALICRRDRATRREQAAHAVEGLRHGGPELLSSRSEAQAAADWLEERVVEDVPQPPERTGEGRLSAPECAGRGRDARALEKARERHEQRNVELLEGIYSHSSPAMSSMRRVPFMLRVGAVI